MTDPVAPLGERAIGFGPFRLFPAQRVLLEGEKPIRLGSRAFDLLTALVERAGEVVGKEELMARAWPKTSVEEGNLKFQISALRRSLGDGHGGNRYLVTVPGRGYSFVGERTVDVQLAHSAPEGRASSRTHNLPALQPRLIGRADVVRALVQQLQTQRLVTIVGPGGIGKTAVALNVAEELIPAYQDGVWLIELAPVADPRLVPTALAFALGLEIRSENPLPSLIASLIDKEMLLVFDNCEHVIEVAATLAMGLLTGAPGVHILATSREPLRVEGERNCRLSALAIPPASVQLTAAEALRFPAVQLFADRAAANLNDFELSDVEASAAGDICRELDGLPLAIELAAARVEVFGIRGLAAHLHDRLQLLTRGRRTAVPRHRTLSATLDWSYQLLTEAEQRVLRCLAIFVGGFTLQAADAVAADAANPVSEVIDQIAELVAKSLVAAEASDGEQRFRLLDTTRAYALSKLAECGEFDQAARHHAEYLRGLFDGDEPEQRAGNTAAWLAGYGRWIDDVRAALDWAFSPGGEATMGVALTIASERLWFGLSLMDECRRHVEYALSSLRPSASRGTRREMQLSATLGATLYYTKGPVPEGCAAWTDVLEIAERLDDSEYRLRALWGLWLYRASNAECRVALALAQRFSDLPPSRADPSDLLIGDRMVGVTNYYLGDLPNARRHLERLLRPYPSLTRRSHIIRFELDPLVTARIFLARILWLQGFPDQAMRMAVDNIEDARANDHVMSMCNALDAAGVVALAVGDLATAERSVAMLLKYSRELALGFWRGWGHSLEGQLLIKRGDFAAGVRSLRTGLDEVRDAHFVLRRPGLLGALAEGLAGLGQMAQAHVAINEALAQCERTDERWSMAELLRIRGELLLLGGAPEAGTAAEDHFLQALDWARRQGTLSWELRCATSLSRLWQEQKRTKEAHGLLSAVYDRFTEGFGTADLLAAKRLTDELSNVGAS